MSVSTLVLLGLAVVWAIVLLPEAVKRVTKARGGDSIRSFNSQLSSLQRKPAHGGNVIDLRAAQRSGRQSAQRSGRQSAQRPLDARRSNSGVGVPATVSPAVRRRRQEVLTVLGSAAVLSLLCSVAFGGPFLALFLVAAVLLVAYVFALYQVTNAAVSASARDPYGISSAARSQRSADTAGVRISPVSARRVAN